MIDVSRPKTIINATEKAETQSEAKKKILERYSHSSKKKYKIISIKEL